MGATKWKVLLLWALLTIMCVPEMASSAPRKSKLRNKTAYYNKINKLHGSDKKAHTDADDGQAPDISIDPTIFESERLPGNLRYMASVGNGHLATTVLGDTVYMNGLYNGYLGLSHRARIPSVHVSNVSVDGFNTDSIRYRLDTTRAVFEMILTASLDASLVEVTQRVYAHHFYNRLLITEIEVSRLDSGQEEAITVSRESLNTDENSIDLILEDTIPYTDSNIGCDAGFPGPCRQRSGQINITETGTSDNTPVYMFWNDIADEFVLEANETSRTWTHVLAVDVVAGVAEDNFIQGMTLVNERNSEELMNSHVSGWSEVWANGRIDIEGDSTILALQKIIRGSLYYLYSSLPSLNTYKPNNRFFGLSPGGLANGVQGFDYYGHVFWDMETWMYPPILMLSPEHARDMLSYRISSVLPAFERAFSGGYQGSRFPWESCFTGVEVTPDVCVECRENQQHITGDIAFAARQYVAATRDTQWLTTNAAGPEVGFNYTGYDFLYNMAQFWYSRPSYSLDKDRFEINGVMPPDEHQLAINNSVYTNVVGSLAIHFARYASCLAGRNPADEVPDRWINVAQSLYFTFNQTKRYHEEYEGYEQDVLNNLTNPEYVKQADVVLLGFPLLWEMPDDVRENDLRHYETVTSPGGPAMTWGMFAVGWLDLGDDAKAASLFDRAYQLYYREPFKVWTEAQEGAGAINFLTGMGGFLQALLSGYGGLRLDVEELRFRRPKLPVGVTRINVTSMDYLGSQMDLTIDSQQVSVTVTSMSASLPLTLFDESGTSWELVEGETRSLPLQDFTIRTLVPSNCPLPLDDIDVNYDPVSQPTTTTPPTEGNASLTTLSCITIALALVIQIAFAQV